MSQEGGDAALSVPRIVPGCRSVGSASKVFCEGYME